MARCRRCHRLAPTRCRGAADRPAGDLDFRAEQRGADWWKNKSTGTYDSLTWDAEDRLVRLRRYASGGSLQLDVTYQYDGFGRRVRQSGTGVDDRLYVWNGWELLAETDLSGNATRRYTHHPEGLDFPLAMREEGGLIGPTTHYLHLDGQGNVYTVTNTSGTRRSEYAFLAWGDRYNMMTENVESPFTYKAREEDRATGLVYMRHRYYSPRLERFLNEDPIGIGGGLNVYAFALQSPPNFRDPFGLQAVNDTPPPRYDVPGFTIWGTVTVNELAIAMALMAFMDTFQALMYMGGSGGGLSGVLMSSPGGNGPATRQATNTTPRQDGDDAEQGSDDWTQCMANQLGALGDLAWEHRETLGRMLVTGAAGTVVARLMIARGEQLRNSKGRPRFGREMMNIGNVRLGFGALASKVAVAFLGGYVLGSAAVCTLD